MRLIYLLIKKITNLIQRFRVIRWRYVWLAYWRLWFVILKIKLTSVKWLKNEVSFTQKTPAPTLTYLKVALDLHESVRLAARLHFKSVGCLPKSIVLKKMMAELGMAAKVYIGVAKLDKGIASHAWVELDGQMICEPEEVATSFNRLSVKGDVL